MTTPFCNEQQTELIRISIKHNRAMCSHERLGIMPVSSIQYKSLTIGVSALCLRTDTQWPNADFDYS